MNNINFLCFSKFIIAYTSCGWLRVSRSDSNNGFYNVDLFSTITDLKTQTYLVTINRSKLKEMQR